MSREPDRQAWPSLEAWQANHNAYLRVFPSDKQFSEANKFDLTSLTAPDIAALSFSFGHMFLPGVYILYYL